MALAQRLYLITHDYSQHEPSDPNANRLAH